MKTKHRRVNRRRVVGSKILIALAQNPDKPVKEIAKMVNACNSYSYKLAKELKAGLEKVPEKPDEPVQKPLNLNVGIMQKIEPPAKPATLTISATSNLHDVWDEASKIQRLNEEITQLRSVIRYLENQLGLKHATPV